MTTTNKDELKRMAVETAYSSKGHFKTADWTNVSLGAYVTVPMVTSIIMAFATLPDAAIKTLSFLGMLFSFLALNSIFASNRDKANRSIEAHLDLGNKYLEIHKEIRVQFADLSNVTGAMLADLQKRISSLDQRTSKCKISFIGRWWAKIRIYPEMDLHWIDGI